MKTTSLFRVATLSLLTLSVGSAHAADEPASTVPAELRTVAERSDYQATSRYDDVMKLCRRLADRSPRIRLAEMGASHEGRKLPLLVIGDPPPSGPQAAGKNGRQVTLILGNIHAGEVCGKEALLMLAREWALTEKTPSVLSKLQILIAPIYNADGNERMAKDNRPGQVGPVKGMGQRANAQGLDLNRDHMKLESPEARALARLLTRWDPAIVIDCHTTNGSYHRYALTYDSPRHPATDPRLIQLARDELLPEVTRRLEKATGYRTFFYGNFADEHQRWETYPALPRYGTHYVGLRGRIGILSEAYAYAPYKQRVLATREFVRHCLELAAERSQRITAVLKAVRVQASKPDKRDVALRFEPVVSQQHVKVPGYVEQQKDGKTVAGDEEREYELTYYGAAKPTVSVPRPFAYLIPAGWPDVIAKLHQHGVQLEVLREDIELDVARYDVTKVERAPRAFQKHHLLTLETDRKNVVHRAPAGTIVVRTAQPLSALIVNLLEPQAADGLAAWNFFDRALSANAEDKQAFPVLCLPESVSLLTAPLSAPNRSPAPVPLLRLGGSSSRFVRIGRSATGVSRWLDDDHFLHSRSGRQFRVHASTGRMQPYRSASQFVKSLAGLRGMDARRSRTLRPQWNADQTAGVVSWKTDLYLGWRDGRPARRLTDAGGREELASFSPDGKYVAFVRDYDLYVVEIESAKERRLTHGGSAMLRNGKTDWVYYEEVNRRNWRAYDWSPDSTSIVFQQFDDSPVEPFSVVNHLATRQEVETERYPLAGRPNPRVRLGVVDVSGGAVQWVPLDEYSPADMLITRSGWFPDSKSVYFYVQDRAQRWLDFIRYDCAAGSTRRVLRERTKAWVDRPPSPHFLKNGTLLWTSERDGWRHLYHYRANGELIAQVTKGPWEVRRMNRVDEGSGWLYFSGTRGSHLTSNLYRVQLDGTKLERLTKRAGSHQVLLNPGGTLFVDTFSDWKTPTQVYLARTDGEVVRTLDSNPQTESPRYRLGAREPLRIKTKDGFELNAALVKPADFDTTKKYPVWVLTYGGPHAPTLSNSWRGGWAYEHGLANEGLLVLRIDPRSASGQGAQSTWTAYRQLGVQELRDLEEALDWLVQKPFVDGSRIGMSGHSYGGFLTAFALTHSKRFSAGIAGAPVTDWRNYDTIYTERYMGTPQDNPEGYKRTSVVGAARNLHGRLLLIHGARDDNVHVANTLQLAQALQRANKPFEMMIYPSSRHGIGGAHYQRLSLDFIRRTMKLKRP